MNTQANNHINFNGMLKVLLLMSFQCKGRSFPSSQSLGGSETLYSHQPFSVTFTDLLWPIAIHNVRHHGYLPVQQRRQLQRNLVGHHHCDVHSWRIFLNGLPAREASIRDPGKTICTLECHQPPCGFCHWGHNLSRTPAFVMGCVWELEALNRGFNC